MGPNDQGTWIMGQVVFLYRSLAYRNAAVEMVRKARKLPRGPEQRAARRYAMALRDLAQTEAWLEGRAAELPADANPPACVEAVSPTRAAARRR
jgi:hypothetical protein